MKKIAIACDRAGVELKKFLIDHLDGDYVLEDLGTNSQDPVDYPDYAKKVVNKILNKEADCGVLICGTGIRAALCHNSLEAKLTREHNNANILCMGARIIGTETALENLKVFLNTDFTGGRHVRRVEKIDEL